MPETPGRRIFHAAAMLNLSYRSIYRYTTLVFVYNGALAEWLRSGLQNRVHRFEPGRCLHTI